MKQQLKSLEENTIHKTTKQDTLVYNSTTPNPEAEQNIVTVTQMSGPQTP
jgi:hypothetical protein